MKYREKLGYIALGGLLMLVGMIAANLTPLSAHLQADKFGLIQCTELQVVNSEGRMKAVVGYTGAGGVIDLYGGKENIGDHIKLGINDGIVTSSTSSSLWLNSKGSSVRIGADRYGKASVSLHSEDPYSEQDSDWWAIMRADRNGAGVRIQDDETRWAGMFCGKSVDGSEIWSRAKGGKVRALK